MINIENFENRREISSPRSLAAIRKCGLEAEDLVQRESVKDKKKSEAYWEKIERRREHLVQEVKEERKRRIQEEERKERKSQMRSNSITEGQQRLLSNIQEERKKLYATMLERQSQVDRKVMSDSKIKERYEQTVQTVQLKARQTSLAWEERKNVSQHKLHVAQQRKQNLLQEQHILLVQNHRLVDEKSQKILERNKEVYRQKLEEKKMTQEKHLQKIVSNQEEQDQKYLLREKVFCQKEQQHGVHKEEQLAVWHSALKEKKSLLNQRVDRTQVAKQQQSEEEQQRIREFLEGQQEKFNENIQQVMVQRSRKIQAEQEQHRAYQARRDRLCEQLEQQEQFKQVERRQVKEERMRRDRERRLREEKLREEKEEESGIKREKVGHVREQQEEAMQRERQTHYVSGEEKVQRSLAKKQKLEQARSVSSQIVAEDRYFKAQRQRKVQLVDREEELQRKREQEEVKTRQLEQDRLRFQQRRQQVRRSVEIQDQEMRERVEQMQAGRIQVGEARHQLSRSLADEHALRSLNSTFTSPQTSGRQQMMRSAVNFHPLGNDSFMKRLKQRVFNDNLAEVVSQFRQQKREESGECDFRGLLREKQNHEMLLSLQEEQNAESMRENLLNQTSMARSKTALSKKICQEKEQALQRVRRLEQHHEKEILQLAAYLQRHQ